MNIKVTSTIALADSNSGSDNWFENLTREEQDKYVEQHPNSKYAKARKNKKGKGSSSNDAKDKLSKKGSPTNYRGPSDKKNSMTGNPKKERKIVTKLDKLAALSRKAAAEGKEAPDYDLCQVSIPGTNLFCSSNKGIPRKEMPQLKGKPVDGSWGAKNLAKNDKGEIDGEAAFKKHLESKGVKMSKGSVPASELKATQNQLVGAKIAGMLQALKKDPKHEGITAPIFVSKDGYILDGHHRWAAMVGLDMADGVKDPVKMDVVKVDMSIEDLVDETNKFSNKLGIAQKAGKVKEQSNSYTDDDCDDCGFNFKEVSSVKNKRTQHNIKVISGLDMETAARSETAAPTKMNKEQIEQWLSKYKVKNYKINPDLTVDVKGDVDLHNKKLKSIPFQFGTVTGDFICSDNKLTSLEGCPKKVGSGFDCSYNTLTTLKGCPTKVGSYFYCYGNKLTTLKGSPIEVVGSFDCSQNKLTTLDGCPRSVGKIFLCSENKLTTLKGSPKEVGGFYCVDNQLKTLDGCPVKVTKEFDCAWNKLTDLKGAPKEVGGSFNCSYNKLKTLEGDLKTVKGNLIIQQNPFNPDPPDTSMISVKRNIIKD